jgi:cold shock CspA family protein
MNDGGASVLASGTVSWFKEESGYGYIVADESGANLLHTKGTP